MAEAIYKRTPKGRAEADAAQSTLDPIPKTLLKFIGEQASFADISRKLSRIPEADLRTAFGTLLKAGLIIAAPAAAAAPAAGDDDLDFTRLMSEPVAPPSAEQVKQAESQTIAGMPRLKKAGFYVNILSRPGKKAPPRSGSKYTVLVFDADEHNGLLLGRTLMGAGFDIRGASNRDDILAQLRKAPLPDAIVMDLVLPQLEGLELLARLRTHPSYTHTPVIIVTEKTDQADVVAALARGAAGYMTKPFKPEGLLDTVRAVLGLA